MGYAVFINQDAGTVLKIGADVLRGKIEEALGPSLERLEFLHPQALEETIESISPETHVLVGGGDGTITAMASVLLKRGTPFGIIPLGTMNLFAQDIGVPLPWDKALAAYAESEERTVDVGMVNGHLFLCNAMFGVTTSIARKREQVRKTFGPHKWLKLGGTFLRKFAAGDRYRVKIASNDHTWNCDYKAIVVSNNKYKEGAGPSCNLKESLEDGKLSVYVINPQNTLESVTLMAHLAAGGWQAEPYVDHFETKSASFHRYKRDFSVMLDGEIKNLRAPLIFEVKPAALNVLVPKICDKEAAA